MYDISVSEDAYGRTRHTLVGITSANSDCNSMPTIYTRVSKKYDWIVKTACNELGSVAGFCRRSKGDKKSAKKYYEGDKAAKQGKTGK